MPSCKFRRTRLRSGRVQQPPGTHRSAQTPQRLKKMGEKMGPNTLAAFHAGADFMAAKMEEEQQDSSDDEALLAGAPLESYGQARMAELREAAERRNRPPGALRVDPTAWRRLVVDASSDRWVLVSLDHPPNSKCETTLEALESIPISRRGGCELRRVESKFCVPEEKLGSLPAIFGGDGGDGGDGDDGDDGGPRRAPRGVARATPLGAQCAERRLKPPHLRAALLVPASTWGWAALAALACRN